MRQAYVRACEFVAMFDADFQPPPDFLVRTVSFLVHNPSLALMQTRWKFGTAGVWRTQAIVESEGWEDRTTAEDMDLVLRAGLMGWEFVYVGSTKVKSELPSTLKAYRS
ncbi:putative mannan synthase 7 [Zea mays]|uniref:Putative mannan synthase 7 n=1 Tax=Zea mays TaxID=4577 RepID=A0A1D6FK99_MAIZE|nr:putative mannan synthase 7 [Zea mays]